MTTRDRIFEIFKFYVNNSPSSEESIIRYNILRNKFSAILDKRENKSLFRSILIAMGNPQLPHQNVIEKMSEEEFLEFVSEDITISRRKEIYNKYI